MLLLCSVYWNAFLAPVLDGSQRICFRRSVWAKSRKNGSNVPSRLNIGLILMLVLSLNAGGIHPAWEVFSSGYWHARSVGIQNSGLLSFLRLLENAGRLGLHFFRRHPLLYHELEKFGDLNSKTEGNNFSF